MTKKTQNKTIGLLFILSTIAFVVPANAKSKKNRLNPMVAYLFTYFTSNTPEGEQIRYAISYDGWNYTPLNNGEPIIASDTISIKKGVRDPHILRGEEGDFYMVVTDMRSHEGWASNRGMVLLRSKDMITWSHSTIHFPTRYAETMFANVIRVWAPQTIYDKKAKKYMVYFSILTNDGGCTYDRVYWAYANRDFTDFEDEPKLLFDRGRSSIDTDIVRDDKGVYHVFFKTEGDQTKGLLKYTTTDLHRQSKWRLHDKFYQQTHEAVEGSGVFRLIDGTWVLMYDCYIKGYYQFCSSPDLEHFTVKQNTQTSGSFTPRHGTVIAITQTELDRILRAFPNN